MSPNPSKVSPQWRRDDMPPADGSSIQKSRRIYVRPRTGPQSARLWWATVAKLLSLGSCAMGQTNGQTDGRIALFQNVPLERGHNYGNRKPAQTFTVCLHHANCTGLQSAYWSSRTPVRLAALEYLSREPSTNRPSFAAANQYTVLYKSLFTENTVATTEKHSSASINTNKAKTTTKSITVVDTCRRPTTPSCNLVDLPTSQP